MFVELPANNNSASKRKPIYGAGINDSPYKIQIIVDGKRYSCHFYNIWFEMIRRCYSKEYQGRKPTYIGCIVCKDWLKFSNFKAWMETQDWQKKELDKDILFPGNKEYSPDNCVFVSRDINTLLNKSLSSKGEHPTGVKFHKASNKFVAECSLYGKQKHIGVYLTASEALSAYKKVKCAHLIEVANSQPENIKQALKRHASLIYNS